MHVTEAVDSMQGSLTVAFEVGRLQRVSRVAVRLRVAIPGALGRARRAVRVAPCESHNTRLLTFGACATNTLRA